ncbi:GNAT family N-acetyltransferase [Qipengyuania sp. MTN3-11]|uniref:GNAT family N-acetyltransferase n=1 Tax=Qipengyuania sp. MTN3-11 TaxID=3056557 RepID=UPI0036F28B87
MTHIDDLTGIAPRDSAGEGLPPPALVDGFHAIAWRHADPSLIRQWQVLAHATASPNPFYEPWYLLPALRQFDPDRAVMLAFTVEQGRLSGLMPLVRRSSHNDRPIPNLANWTHANQFFGAPLIRPDREAHFWNGLLSWCDREARTALFLHLNTLALEGGTLAVLEDVCRSTRRPLRVVHREERAALKAGPTPQEHLDACLVKKRRKELDRKRRRLEEMGLLEFTRAIDDGGIARWTDEFLALEKAGWKGEAGSALASDPRTENLFRESIAAAAGEGRLERLAFHLDGQPIAMLASFVAPPIAFSYKTAFDDALAKLSPGLLLQVENLRVLERKEIVMSDSCAAPGHPMIDHFWRDRRTVGNVTIGIGGKMRRSIGAAIAAIEARNLETTP